jgi:hypothetical protein
MTNGTASITSRAPSGGLALERRLVAIAGENLSFQKSAVTAWWQRIAARYRVRANYGLSGGVYRRDGTTFGLQILVIDKIGPTPGGTWQQ